MGDDYKLGNPISYRKKPEFENNASESAGVARNLNDREKEAVANKASSVVRLRNEPSAKKAGKFKKG